MASVAWNISNCRYHITLFHTGFYSALVFTRTQLIYCQDVQYITQKRHHGKWLNYYRSEKTSIRRDDKNKKRSNEWKPNQQAWD